MKRIFKWFMNHPWYERIIIAIPALIIALLIVWFIFTAIVMAVMLSIENYHRGAGAGLILK
jgi:hypothetical protein